MIRRREVVQDANLRYATNRAIEMETPRKGSGFRGLLSGDSSVTCSNFGHLRIFMEIPVFCVRATGNAFLVHILPDGHPCAKCHDYVDECPPPITPIKLFTVSKYRIPDGAFTLRTKYYLLWQQLRERGTPPPPTIRRKASAGRLLGMYAISGATKF